MKQEFLGYKNMSESDIEKHAKTGQTFLDGTKIVLVKSDIKVDYRGVVFEREYKKTPVGNTPSEKQ